MFSVIIPVYNNDISLLRKAVDSVHNQTYEDYEIVIVNDGATNDDVIWTLEKISNEANVKYIISERNRGIAAARQLGIEKSEHEWICFLDCDDEYAPDYLETFYSYIKQEPDIDVWMAGYQVVDSEKKILSTYPKDGIRDEIYRFYASSAIWNRAYRRSFVKENNIHFPEKCLTEDMTFLLQICRYTDKIKCIDQITYLNLLNPKSTSRSKKFTQLTIDSMPFDDIKKTMDEFKNVDCDEQRRNVFFGMVLEQVTVLCCLLCRNVERREEKNLIISEGSIVIDSIPDILTICEHWNEGILRDHRLMTIIEKMICISSKIHCERVIIRLINTIIGKCI